ncbi:MAG: hypothetical protein V2I48_15725 [Xanthomonadales bacterium]|jgi:hypothetical protein|nr:hypothetical protein [Xanthomonadales bacterium]
MTNQQLLNSQEAREVIALLEHIKNTPLHELDMPHVSPEAARKFLALIQREAAQ